MKEFDKFFTICLCIRKEWRNIWKIQKKKLEEKKKPYVSVSEFGRQYLCTPSECGCKKCNCQDEFMEKDRILSGIEDAVTHDGLKVLDGDNDCIIVRNSRLGKDFEISVKCFQE